MVATRSAALSASRGIELPVKAATGRQQKPKPGSTQKENGPRQPCEAPPAPDPNDESKIQTSNDTNERTEKPSRPKAAPKKKAGRRTTNSKEIVQVCCKTGNLLGKYRDSVHAARCLIESDCKGGDQKYIRQIIYGNLRGARLQPVLNKYNYRYADEEPEQSILHRRLQDTEKVQQQAKAPIVQFCPTTGKIIKTHDNINLASKALRQEESSSNPEADTKGFQRAIKVAIHNILTGRRLKPVLNKYYFRYASEKPEESAIHRALKDSSRRGGTSLRVIQVCAFSGKILGYYNSIGLAAKAICEPDADYNAERAVYKAIMKSASGRGKKPVLGVYEFRRATKTREEYDIQTDPAPTENEKGTSACYDNSFSVVQLCANTTEVLAQYESIESAATMLCGADADAHAVTKLCNAIYENVTGTAKVRVLGRFHFRRDEDDDDDDEGSEEGAVTGYTFGDHIEEHGYNQNEKHSFQANSNYNNHNADPYVQFCSRTAEFLADDDSVDLDARTLFEPDTDDSEEVTELYNCLFDNMTAV